MPRLTPDILIQAYASGVFPMANSAKDHRLFWVDPEERGILPLEEFHVPRSLMKTLRRAPFEVRCDSAFGEVIRLCGESAPDRPGTWINGEIIRLFESLHRAGLAHSVECWREGRLVGGLYGLHLGGAFFGESMVSRETDASKIALCHLVARLKWAGFTLLDTQFITDHLSRFGAREIPRAEYLARLDEALRLAPQFPLDLPVSPSELLKQSSTQIS